MSKSQFFGWMLNLLGVMLFVVMLATRSVDGWLGKAVVGSFAAAFLVSFIGRNIKTVEPPDETQDSPSISN